jgi:hypothetical protein
MTLIESVKLVVDAHRVVREYEDPEVLRPAIALDEEPVEVRMARYVLDQVVDLEWLRGKFGPPRHHGGDLIWERKSPMYENVTFRLTLIEAVYVQVERITGCGTGELVAKSPDVTVFKRCLENLARFYFFR